MEDRGFSAVERMRDIAGILLGFGVAEAAAEGVGMRQQTGNEHQLMISWLYSPSRRGLVSANLDHDGKSFGEKIGKGRQSFH